MIVDEDEIQEKSWQIKTFSLLASFVFSRNVFTNLT